MYIYVRGAQPPTRGRRRAKHAGAGAGAGAGGTRKGLVEGLGLGGKNAGVEQRALRDEAVERGDRDRRKSRMAAKTKLYDKLSACYACGRCASCYTCRELRAMRVACACYACHAVWWVRVSCVHSVHVCHVCGGWQSTFCNPLTRVCVPPCSEHGGDLQAHGMEDGECLVDFVEKREMGWHPRSARSHGGLPPPRRHTARATHAGGPTKRAKRARSRSRDSSTDSDNSSDAGAKHRHECVRVCVCARCVRLCAWVGVRACLGVGVGVCLVPTVSRAAS